LEFLDLLALNIKYLLNDCLKVLIIHFKVAFFITFNYFFNIASIIIFELTEINILQILNLIKPPEYDLKVMGFQVPLVLPDVLAELLYPRDVLRLNPLLKHSHILLQYYHNIHFQILSLNL